MEFIAQTNLQLYNQLRRQGRANDELQLVRAAYELAATLYSGCYSGDRKPFVAHSVGVASVLAHLELPTTLVAAGVLHNVYGNGNFGDGRVNSATVRRRRLVRQAVGPEVEEVVQRFFSARVRPNAGDDYSARIAQLAASDPQMLLFDLADILEKQVDCSVLYHGDGEWIRAPVARYGGQLIELARQAGQPKLASMLADGFAQVAADPGLPQALRGPKERKHLALVVPLSCRQRWYPRVVKLARWLARPTGWSLTLRRYGARLAGPTRA